MKGGRWVHLLWVCLLMIPGPAGAQTRPAAARDTSRAKAGAVANPPARPGAAVKTGTRAGAAKGVPGQHPPIDRKKKPGRHPTLDGPMSATPSVITPKARAAAAALKVKQVAMLVSHRVFPDFRDAAQVAIRQEFPVGDGEYTARILEWVPDFAIDVKTHRIGTRSLEPKNPAFRILVRKNGVPQDTTWAFLNMPPHFARRSMLAFKIQRIDFDGRPSITADTSRAAAMMGKR